MTMETERIVTLTCDVCGNKVKNFRDITTETHPIFYEVGKVTHDKKSNGRNRASIDQCFDCSLLIRKAIDDVIVKIQGT